MCDRSKNRNYCVYCVLQYFFSFIFCYYFTYVTMFCYKTQKYDVKKVDAMIVGSHNFCGVGCCCCTVAQRMVVVTSMMTVLS